MLTPGFTKGPTVAAKSSARTSIQTGDPADFASTPVTGNTLLESGVPFAPDIRRNPSLSVFTCRYVQYCMQRIALLQEHGVIPVVVFDGGRLPMKQDEESGRHRWDSSPRLRIIQCPDGESFPENPHQFGRVPPETIRICLSGPQKCFVHLCNKLLRDTCFSHLSHLVLNSSNQLLCFARIRCFLWEQNTMGYSLMTQEEMQHFAITIIINSDHNRLSSVMKSGPILAFEFQGFPGSVWCTGHGERIWRRRELSWPPATPRQALSATSGQWTSARRWPSASSM